MTLKTITLTKEIQKPITTEGKTQTNGFKPAFIIRAAGQQNKLPRDIVEFPSLEIFRERLDKHMSGFV